MSKKVKKKILFHFQNNLTSSFTNKIYILQKKSKSRYIVWDFSKNSLWIHLKDIYKKKKSLFIFKSQKK